MKHRKTSFYTLSEDPALKWMIIVSVVAHVLVLVGALVIPNLGAESAPFEPAYSVELVDPQPAPPAPPATKAPAPAPKAEKAPAPPTPPEPKPDPTPRVDTVPDTVEPDPIPIVKKPRSQKVVVKKESTEDRITEQLKKIEQKTEQKKQVQSEKRIDDVIAKLRSSSETTASDSSAETNTSGNIGLKLQLYKTRIWNKVRGNWSYPDILAAKKGLEAVVLVSVSKDGKILSQKLIKTSGDPLFDQSVIRAVKLSDPLPPFPDGYVKRYEELELRFNLAELARVS